MSNHIILNLFDGNTNVTTQVGAGQNLSDEMRTYYSDYLIDVAQPELVHDQFAQKHPIPKHGGKSVQFRKYSALPKALTPLTEGVTPDGQKINVDSVTAAVQQYGGYVELSDMLLLTAIDNNLLEATKLMGAQAGSTLDTITREVLAGGTNVQYADGTTVTQRGALRKGEPSHYLTVDAVRAAVRTLKRQNAKRINGYYCGIIHPDVAYDLMSDEKWVHVKTYADPEGIYEGEIGRIEGVRFVETTEAKVFEGEGADGCDVYATLIIGADAYGVTEVEGGGLQHIVKQLGSAGSGDPLNQRATAGWKATKAAVRLNEANMVRIETSASYSA